jgi:hypothetical protein
MAKWVYTCKAGVELRQLISKAGSWEMSIVILAQLKACYQEIIQNFPWENEFQRTMAVNAASPLDLDMSAIIKWMEKKEDIRNYGFEHDLKLVDARLSEFYSICDDIRVKV